MAVCLSDGITMERRLVPGEALWAYSLCFASPPWRRMGLGWRRVDAEKDWRAHERRYMSVCSRCSPITEGHRGGHTASTRNPRADGYIKA